jgi:hypothetical protein
MMPSHLVDPLLGQLGFQASTGLIVLLALLVAPLLLE